MYVDQIHKSHQEKIKKKYKHLRNQIDQIPNITTSKFIQNSKNPDSKDTEFNLFYQRKRLTKQSSSMVKIYFFLDTM